MMKDCHGCLAFEEKEGKDGHMKPYCDMYGLFIKRVDCPCNYWDDKITQVIDKEEI